MRMLETSRLIWICSGCLDEFIALNYLDPIYTSYLVMGKSAAIQVGLSSNVMIIMSEELRLDIFRRRRKDSRLLRMRRRRKDPRLFRMHDETIESTFLSSRGWVPRAHRGQTAAGPNILQWPVRQMFEMTHDRHKSTWNYEIVSDHLNFH